MIELSIEDMTCGGCVASITRVLRGLDPDVVVDADLDARRVKIDTPLDTEAVLAVIENAGFHPRAIT